MFQLLVVKGAARNIHVPVMCGRVLLGTVSLLICIHVLNPEVYEPQNLKIPLVGSMTETCFLANLKVTVW